jgi:hypothetical protein
MPSSKHRRRGRQRLRLNRKVIAGVISSPVTQALLHTASLIDERARQLYGDRELTDDEFEQYSISLSPKGKSGLATLWKGSDTG